MGEWVINIDTSAWKMKDIRSFKKLLGGKGDIDEGELYPHLVKLVVSWPHEGLDPTLEASYDELTKTEFVEVLNQVTAAFQRSANEPKDQ